jgi:hypothetical protein
MRSKFHVALVPNADGSFLGDEELRTTLRRYGWEASATAKLPTEDEKIVVYRNEAKRLFADKVIPEVTEPEIEETIFYGVIRSDQTEFFVTRTQGEMTYRLIQPELTPLLSATNKLLRAIGGGKRPHNIVDNKITVYERAHNHIIFSGRLVESPFRETLRANPKDSLVMGLVALFVVLSTVTHFGFNLRILSQQDLDKLTFSIIAVSLVSFIGLAITYFSIKGSKLISWKFLE